MEDKINPNKRRRLRPVTTNPNKRKTTVDAGITFTKVHEMNKKALEILAKRF